MILRVYQERIYAIDSVENRRVAIVFGAAVYSNGRLSSVLRDRIDTAIILYKSGAVDRLILSGDGSAVSNFEPQAMRDYALSLDVPNEAITIDENGTRTYNTCYRAWHVYEIDEAILITQDFHLPRALFTCDRLGIEAIGVAADRRPYRAARWYEVRETFATLIALADLVRGS